MDFNTTLNNGKKLYIRQAKPEDAKKMIDYLNLVGGESNNLMFGKDEFLLSQEQEEKYIMEINKTINSKIFVGLIDNEIISVSQIIGENRNRISHNSSLSISVKKEYWGIGIGTLMLSEVIKFAKSTKIISNIHLTVNSTNDRAISLYKKFGFEIIGEHKNYTKIDNHYYNEKLMDLSLN